MCSPSTGDCCEQSVNRTKATGTIIKSNITTCFSRYSVVLRNPAQWPGSGPGVCWLVGRPFFEFGTKGEVMRPHCWEKKKKTPILTYLFIYFPKNYSCILNPKQRGWRGRNYSTSCDPNCQVITFSDPLIWFPFGSSIIGSLFLGFIQ